MAKIPIIVAYKLNRSDLMAIKSGMPRMKYRINIEDREIVNVFLFDFISLSGIVWPIRMKLMILQRVPRRNPFPISVRPAI